MKTLKILNGLLLFSLYVNNTPAQNSQYTDVRNIAFFYKESDSLFAEDIMVWTACAQIIYMRADSIFDQIFLVNQITDSPYTTSNKADIKIVQFIMNFDNSINKGVFAIDYERIIKTSDSFFIKPSTVSSLESSLQKCDEIKLIKLYYFKKKDKNISENMFIQQDQITLELQPQREPFVREYMITNNTTNKNQKVKVLVL